MRTYARAALRATARDVMRTQVVTAVPEMTVRELAHLLVEERISGAPVLDRAGKLVGVASCTDVLALVARDRGGRQLSAQGSPPAGASDLEPSPRSVLTALVGAGEEAAPLDRRRVEEIMSPVVLIVAPGDPVHHVVRIFVQRGVHRLPVVENGILLGIVTPMDVLRALDSESLAVTTQLPSDGLQ